MIYQTNGNIFLTPANITISCFVSADKVFEKDMFVQINKLYPNMMPHFEDTNFIVGNAYGYTDPISKRNIINIVTNDKDIEPPTYTFIEKSIYKLKELATSHRIKNIAFPQINNELNWGRIYYILAGIFSESPTNIIIYKI